jgi:hypothetical protein
VTALKILIRPKKTPIRRRWEIQDWESLRLYKETPDVSVYILEKLRKQLLLISMTSRMCLQGEVEMTKNKQRIVIRTAN